MTPAEAQEALVRAGLEVQLRQSEYQRHGSTVSSVARRLEEIAQTLHAAERILPDGDALLPRATEVACEEARYWLRVYVESAPRMQAARDAAVEEQAKMDRVQDDVRAALVAEEVRRKGGSAA